MRRAIKTTVCLPAELKEEYEKHKDSICLSRLLADALREALKKCERFEEWYQTQKEEENAAKNRK